jgi:hypothetical protein
VIFELITAVDVSIAVFGDVWQRGTNVLNEPALSIFRIEGDSAGSSEILANTYQTKLCQIQENNNLKFILFVVEIS